MSNTIFITANWTTGALSQQTISRQYDNNRYAVQFIGYPEGDGTEELDLYLLVWMSTAPGQKPGEITPIQLNSDQWYISNYFTQQVQVIKFQLCVLNEAGTYEAHSPIFSGRIGDSLEHNGTSHDIDVSTLFDAYREYLNELIIGAGAVIIDPTPTQGSTNAVSSGGVYSALADKADKENTPKNVTPEETDADFYLSDERGNVLLELADGHIKTKEFDSSGINTETDTTLSVQGKPADAKAVGDAISAVEDDIQIVEESIPDVSGFADVKTPQETTADLFICDSRGNVIAELKDGHIRTKNFNSENVGTDIVGTTRDNTAQLYVCDSSGNVIAELADGYINTKYFDSAEIKALVEKHDTPIWTGKKWACVGDSLTESYRRASKLYHDYISEATGISAYNMGHSGCGYAMVGGYGKNFIGIAGEIPNDADVITVFGSGNDMSAGLDIGTITDTGNTTLCGCINQTLDVIFNNYPLVPLGVITPTPWMYTEPSDTNTGATKMQSYVGAIVQICARRGIPCLDLYHCSNLHPSNATFRTLAYSKDDGEGTHPDEKGHAIIAPRFEAFLKTLLLV